METLVVVDVVVLFKEVRIDDVVKIVENGLTLVVVCALTTGSFQSIESRIEKAIRHTRKTVKNLCFLFCECIKFYVLNKLTWK